MTIPEALLALSGSRELSVVLKSTILLTAADGRPRQCSGAAPGPCPCVRGSSDTSAGDCGRSRIPRRYRGHAFEASSYRRSGADSGRH